MLISVIMLAWALLIVTDVIPVAQADRIPGSVILFLVGLMMGLLAAAFASYFVVADEQGLRFGYRWWHTQAAYDAIERARAIQVTWLTFTGLGWRIDVRGRIGYIARTGPAVEISVRPGRTYVASCKDPSGLLQVLSQHGIPVSDSSPEQSGGQSELAG